MGTIDQQVLWAKASMLLDCVVVELDATPDGAPAWRAVVPGQTIITEACHCGQLTVHVPRMFPSDRFPDLLQNPRGNCDPKFTVADMVVTMLRCAPQPDDQGRPPPVDKITEAARRDFDDRYAMRKAATCCALGLKLIGDHLAVGEEGVCVGSELHVFVALLNCESC